MSTLTKSQKKNLAKKKSRKKYTENYDKYFSEYWENGKIGIWAPNGNYKYILPENIHKIPLTTREIIEKFPHDNETNDINCPYFFENIKQRLNGRPKKEVMETLIQKDRFNFTIIEYICMYIYKKDNLEYFMEFLKTAPIGFFKNYENIQGGNPLHSCAKCKNIYALKKMLTLGFDKNQKNKKGETIKDILNTQASTYQKYLDLSREMIKEL